jgi:hypothetical protein
MALSLLTLRPIGSGNDPATVRRAAFSLAQDLERGLTRARAERTPWYWIVSDTDVLPADTACRAYTLVSSLDPLPVEVDWTMLPGDVAFSPDGDTDVRDLIGTDPVMTYTLFPSALVEEELKRITGDFRVLAVLMPDGGLRFGPDREPDPASIRLAFGSWSGGVYLDDEEGGFPVRLRLRPQTGVIRVEEVEE